MLFEFYVDFRRYLFSEVFAIESRGISQDAIIDSPVVLYWLCFMAIINTIRGQSLNIKNSAASDRVLTERSKNLGGLPPCWIV